MCNDFRLKAKLDYLIETFRETRIPLRFPAGLPNLEPREDIRITDRSAIVRGSEDDGVLEMAPWSWKGPTGKPVFNFRSEGRRFGKDRCLILADGFYEFTGQKSPKAKWLFTVADSPLFAIAGVMREGAFTMLTCEPGPDIAPYHDRQIVVLRPGQWSGWLSHAENERELLRPLAEGSLRVERVA
jgi:putative SOS response-associated peptidase YedK